MGIITNFITATTIPVIITGFWAVFLYYKKRKLETFDLFIKYREKLKTNPATSRIIRHIQDWQLTPEIRNQIQERGITINDFYDFLGFYEEIWLLYKNCLISKTFVRKMFAFYAIEIADNDFYWEHFDENYRTDPYWEDFRKLINKMR